MVNINIVLPTSDRINTFKWSLKTCLNQDYKNYKIWVIDNSKSNDTYNLVEEINDPRINYFKTDKKISMQKNWEFALENVLKSEKEGYIGYLGDDDGLYPNSLKHAVDLIRKTNTNVVKYRFPEYFWPNTLGYNAKITFRNSNEYKIINSKNLLSSYSKNLRSDPFYWIAPDIYKGFINIDILKKIKNNDKYFFNHFIPDIYSSIRIAAEINDYVLSFSPVFISGCSSNSNGFSNNQSKINKNNKKAKKISDEFFSLGGYNKYQHIDLNFIEYNSKKDAIDCFNESFFIGDCFYEAFKHNNNIPLPSKADILKSQMKYQIFILDHDHLKDNLLESCKIFAEKYNLCELYNKLLKYYNENSINKEDVTHTPEHTFYFFEINTQYYSKELPEIKNINEACIHIKKEFEIYSNKLMYKSLLINNNKKEKNYYDMFLKKITPFNNPIKKKKEIYYERFLENNNRFNNSIKTNIKSICKNNFKTDFMIILNIKDLENPNFYNCYKVLNINYNKTSIEEKYIGKINNNYDQVWVNSNYQKRIYSESGIVESKIKVLPIGVDENIYNPKNKKIDLPTKKSFKYLFINNFEDISILKNTIKSYLETFSSIDDVSLVIKNIFIDKDGFIKNFIDEITNSSSAEIIIYNNQSPNVLPNLYCSCDCLIYPQENFEYLTILEAMFSNLTVITLNGGEYLDYCNNDNSYLIKSEKIYTDIDKIEEEYLVDNLYFFEIDWVNLNSLLKEAFTNKDILKRKAKKAYEYVLNNYKLESLFSLIDNNLSELNKEPNIRNNFEEIMQKLKLEANEQLENNNFVEAESKFLDLTKYYPNIFSNYYYLGLSQFNQKNYEAAIESFSESIEQGNESNNVFYYMAKSLEKNGENELAKLYYNKVKN